MYGCPNYNKVPTRTDNLKHNKQLHKESTLDQESVGTELELVNDHELVGESGNGTESDQESDDSRESQPDS